MSVVCVCVCVKFPQGDEKQEHVALMHGDDHGKCVCVCVCACVCACMRACVHPPPEIIV